MTQRYIVGSALDVAATLAPDSVDAVITSPPFLGLRAYTDDPAELGIETSPGEFLDRLLEVVGALARVLKPTGSLCVELGDTFADSGGAGGDYNPGGLREGQPRWRQRSDRGERRVVGGDNRPGGHHRGGVGWPEGKSLCLIPHLFAAALAYGFNPLTGTPVDRWRVRNMICWARTNPTPGSTADKVRTGTSYITVACRHRSRYWDAAAIAVPKADSPGNRYVRNVSELDDERRPDGSYAVSSDNRITAAYDPNERDWTVPLDWMIEPGEDTWVLANARGVRSPVAASEHEHYAVWPEELARRLILAMVPPGGMVLDPFAGSATTLAAAQGVGRSAIGIDLDARNAELAREKVGMFLEVEGA